MRFRLFLLSLLAAASLPSRAQEGAVAPTLAAQAVEEDFTVDGAVLGDPVWRAVPVATGFIQTSPFAGRAASEKTEVRVVFTDTTLYIGVVCFDGTPERIIISDTRRDSSLRDTDSFQIILDTYADQQNGFVFGTNPAGIEYDGQVQNEGRRGSGGGPRQQRGAGGGFNLNWDAAWEVATKVGDFGWSAEFAIPFSTLRYPSSERQLWGLNFQRNIRRKIEIAFWAPLERQHDLYRVSDAGTLTGLDAPPQRLLQLIPYGLAESSRSALSERRSNLELGVDLKYGITPTLTLDATYNTDFAQVEVDDQQINLDRFSLFFPEKRPFFLENAGLFTVGIPGSAELFFSRRIGLIEGEPIPILGGVRLTGKVGDTRLGFLDMQTEATSGHHADNFSVARVRQEFANRSHLGAIVVNRQGTGSERPSHDYNRTFAVDGQKGFGEHTELSAFVAKTSTPGFQSDEHAFQLRLSSESERLRWFLDYAEVGEGFNPEVGFLARKAFRSPSGLLFFTLRPDDLWGLQEIRPHVSYRGFWDFDGFQETGFLHVDTHWEWRSGYGFHTGVNFTLEGLKEPFEISDDVLVPVGTHQNKELQLAFNTDAGKPISFRIRSTVGGFFDGHRVSLSPSLRLRRGEKLTSQISWSYNDIDLASGGFETNLGRLRLTYSFSNSLFIQALVQYNDTRDDVSTNLRFTWLQTANTGLFVVYNEIREFGSLGLERPDRKVIVKYSRLIDVLE